MMAAAVREASVLVLVSCVLGVGYTAAAKKGFFADKPPQPTVAPQLIQLEEAKKIFDEHTALFIDSRHEFDFKAGHIQESINIPLNTFDTDVAKLAAIDKTHLLVVYCDGADCNSSFELAGKLYTAGYRNLRIFFGGWEDWQENHYPTATQ